MTTLVIDTIQTAETVEKVLIWIVSLLVVFDIYLYLNNTKGDTISNILLGWVKGKYFFISYVWGVLAGHFFLGTKSPPFGMESNLLSLIIVISIAIILLVMGMRKVKLKPVHQISLLVFGTLIGHFFWSLNSI